MTRDFKALPVYGLDQLRIEFLDQVRVVRQRQVNHLSGALAAEMIVRLAAAVVTGGAGDVGNAVGQVRIDERFERLVDRGQAEVGDVLADGGEHLLGGGMPLRAAQVGKYRGPLARIAPACMFESATQVRVLDGTGCGSAVKIIHTIHVRETGRRVKKAAQPSGIGLAIIPNDIRRP